MSRRGLALVALLTALATTSLAPGLAGAHASLDAAYPEPGGELAVGAGALRLRFTESLDPIHTGATVRRLDGSALPATSQLSPWRADELLVETPPLDEGVYIVEWQALSLDGHTSRGTLAFRVGDAPPAEALGGAVGPTADEGAPGEALLRALLSGGLVVGLGAALFAAVIHPRLSGLRRLHALLAVSATIAAIGAAGFLAGLDARIDGSALSTLAGRLRAAEGLLLAGLAALVLARGLPRGASLHARHGVVRAALALGVLAAGLHALAGHALAGGLARDAPHAAHYGVLTFGAHLGAAAVWTGGVAAFLLALPGLGAGEAGPIARRFTPWAFASVTVLAGSGLALAWTHAGPIREAAGSAYATFLVVKTLLLLPLLALGARHARKLATRAARGLPTTQLRRSLGAEAALLGAVLLAAGALAATAPPTGVPGAAEPAARTFAADLGDAQMRLALGPDPLAAGTPLDARVRLESDQFGAHEDAALVLILEGDGGRVEAPMRKEAYGAWHVEGLLAPEPGAWEARILVLSPSGDASATFPVVIRPASEGDFSTSV